MLQEYKPKRILNSFTPINEPQIVLLVAIGDHVALIYPPGVDLIAAFYGCLYVGVVPVTIRPPHPQNLQTTLPTVRMIVDVSKSAVVLSSQQVIKLLKSKVSARPVSRFRKKTKMFS